MGIIGDGGDSSESSHHEAVVWPSGAVYGGVSWLPISGVVWPALAETLTGVQHFNAIFC